jgi:protocatechuate 3,4-dioxygenase alpha subunit
LIFPSTPSQTVGPDFAISLPWAQGPCAVPADTPGSIRIAGVVYDGGGDPVPDSLIETWQADPDGRATRIYFADEPQANANDPVLRSVPAERRDTLLAQPTEGGYRFDIRLQGPGETVFFSV